MELCERADFSHGEPDMSSDCQLHVERTAESDSLRWVVDRPVAGDAGGASFATRPEPGVSPLASRLFSVEGVTRVVLGPDFAIVTKRDDLAWPDLVPGVMASIRSWAEADEPALGADYVPPGVDGDLVIAERIRRILEDEVAPYVAQDGGEISFLNYSNGVVEVALKGACAGCPSSSITLKMVIETRLKREIPEVVAVVAV